MGTAFNAADMMGTAAGYGQQASNTVGKIAGTKFGQNLMGSAGTAIGGAAIKGIFNVLTGNGPLQRKKKAASSAAAGCSCKAEKPKYTCEQKCAYGRQMAQKCQGCRGYTGKGPGGYKRRYGKGGYSYGGRSYSGYSSSGYRSTVPYGGSKPRVSGRQYRRSLRTAGRQTRRTNRQAARQARRARRRN